MTQETESPDIPGGRNLAQRVTSGGDELRFDMLETIRECARERPWRSVKMP